MEKVVQESAVANQCCKSEGKHEKKLASSDELTSFSLTRIGCFREILKANCA